MRIGDFVWTQRNLESQIDQTEANIAIMDLQFTTTVIHTHVSFHGYCFFFLETERHITKL